MKIAIINDTHAGIKNDAPVFLDHMKTFLDNEFFPYLDKHDIKTVIHLGDLLHRRKYANIYTIHRLKEDFLNPILNRQIDFHLLLGNHDTYYRTTNKVSSVYGLLSPYKLHLYDKATEVVFDGTKVLFVPWICEENKTETLNLVASTKAQICMGHLELSGFQMQRGVVINHGFDRNLFYHFDVVLSGHYHHKSSDGIIHYLGGPSEFDWADYNDPKGFHIFDTSTRELTFIPNPRRIFHIIRYDENEDMKSMDVSHLKNCIVKIFIENKTNQTRFDMFLDRVEKTNPFETLVIEKSFIIPSEEVSEIETTMEIFKKYIMSSDVSNKESLIENVSKLYEEALTLE